MKNPRQINTLKRGFSLVELLVVIAIIATLAGVGYPTITSAIRNAKIKEGEKMANDLIFAIEQFEQKYDYLPYPSVRISLNGEDGEESGESGASEDVERYITNNGGLLRALMGQDEDVNPSNTVFFEANAAKNKVNGIVFGDDGETPIALLDPWGNPYVVVIDHSGERKINFRNVPEFAAYRESSGAPIVLRKAVAVASGGPDNELNDKHDVKTWK